MKAPAEPAQVRLDATDTLPEKPDASEPLDAPAHDPLRIRGEALRRSLRYTTLAWVYGAVWMAAIMGGTATKLAEHLGANDKIFALLAAGPLRPKNLGSETA